MLNWETSAWFRKFNTKSWRWDRNCRKRNRPACRSLRMRQMQSHKKKRNVRLGKWAERLVTWKIDAKSAAGAKMNEENVQRSLRFDVTEFKFKKRVCWKHQTFEPGRSSFIIYGRWVVAKSCLSWCHSTWAPWRMCLPFVCWMTLIPFGWIEHVANEKPDPSIAILCSRIFCLSAIVLRKVPKSWIYCCQFGLPFGQLVSLEPLPHMPRSLEWWVCNDFVQLTWTNKNKSVRELFDPLRKPSTLPVSESMAFRWVWVSAFYKLKSQCKSWGVSKHLFRTCPVEMCWPPLAW